MMEDGLQNRAVAIGNVSILPIVHDVIGSMVPVPKTERGTIRRHSELLVEERLCNRLRRDHIAEQGREVPGVRISAVDHRPWTVAANHPTRREAATFESAIGDHTASTRHHRYKSVPK